MAEDELNYSIEERIAEIVNEDTELRIQLTDSDDDDEFVNKYGAIEFQYIKRPRDAIWFVRPHALNYFKDGVLYRTKGERGSGKTELFLDLIYVAIIANVAGEASENALWGSLLKYILTFLPYWTVWADIKDFTNYYYNEDLSQKLYILWILVLLTLSVNSHSGLLDGVPGAAWTIVPYMMCRLSLALSLFLYSFFIPEHRAQMRLYFCLLLITTSIWIPVIFVGVRAKIGLAVVAIVLEQLTIMVVFHPTTKRLMKLTMSTALNIEHEVERYATFVTIALGEFLYKVAATLSLGVGLTQAFGRGCFLLIIAYALFWLYLNGGTAKKAIHPLRHSATRAIFWLYMHIPLVAGIVLAADAGGDLLTRELEHTPAEKRSETAEAITEAISAIAEPDLRALTFFFTGGICVALVSIGFLGLAEACKEEPGIFVVNKFWRIVWRIPAGIVILCLAFADMDITQMMGLTTMICAVVLIYESIVSTPRKHFRYSV